LKGNSMEFISYNQYNDGGGAHYVRLINGLIYVADDSDGFKVLKLEESNEGKTTNLSTSFVLLEFIILLSPVSLQRKK
ncbi:MAG: hypothetical protein ACFFAU_21615, partial [Candidatus Hodarchaeota archaeon]